MDTVSNGGFLQFSAGGILSPLPGDLHRDYGPCDYDIRHNLNAQYVYQLPVKVRNQWLGACAEWVAGFGNRVLAQRRSVLRPEHAVFGERKRNRARQRTTVRKPCARSPIPTVVTAIFGVTQPGTVQWLNPDAFASAVDPSTGACVGGDSAANCQFGNSRRNQFRGPEFVLVRHVSDETNPSWRKVVMRLEAQFFNVFNHPNFGLPSMVLAGVPGKLLNANRIWSADLHDLSADWPARRGLGWR